MDPLTTLILFIGGLFATAIILFIGRWFDSFFKCSIMRMITKKNYVLIEVVESDGKNGLFYVVNIDMGRIKVGKFVWIFNQADVCREDMTEKGFAIQNQHVRWINGIPVVRIDKDSIMPRRMEGSPSKVKPDEIWSIFTAWIANERAEMMMAMPNILNTIMILVIASIILNGIISYMVKTQVDTVAKQLNETFYDVKAMKVQMGLPYNSTVTTTIK